MNTKQLLISSLIVVAGAVATAPVRAAGTETLTAWSPTTRADVRAQVLEARAPGQLRPAGEASEPRAYRFGAPTRTREEVRAEVVQARLSGDLVAAGQGAEFDEATGLSMRARADVRAETVMARLQGELIPSGEGFGPVDRGPRLVRYTGETMAKATRRCHRCGGDAQGRRRRAGGEACHPAQCVAPSAGRRTPPGPACLSRRRKPGPHRSASAPSDAPITPLPTIRRPRPT